MKKKIDLRSKYGTGNLKLTHKFSLVDAFKRFRTNFNNYYSTWDSFSRFFIPIIIYTLILWALKHRMNIRMLVKANNFINLAIIMCIYLFFMILWQSHKPREPQGVLGL
jgi:hypothetical protein